MDADSLAMQGARASATMILTMLNRINSVPTRLGLRYWSRQATILAKHWSLCFAEFDMSRTSDRTRKEQLLGTLARDGHPMGKFMCGKYTVKSLI